MEFQFVRMSRVAREDAWLMFGDKIAAFQVHHVRPEAVVECLGQK